MTPKVEWRVLAGALAMCAFATSAFGARQPQQAGESQSSAGETKETLESSKSARNKDADSLDYKPASDSSSSFSRGVSSLARDFVEDQKQIWTSPARLRFSDTEWLVPLSGITAGLLVTDRDFSKHLSQNPATISHYKTISDAGVGALVGGAGGMWLLGHVGHHEHWSETGFLAGESALNSLVLVEGMKYSLRRERPYEGDGSGPFFQSGGTSFPSEHAAAAWSVAGVIAHEYPGPLTKLAAYGLASLVSVSRVKARQHFPSDVLVGSMLGNLIAQDIYSRRHDPELGGEAWRSVSQWFREKSGSPGNQGSPYVPMDSWVYPALDRLAAMGLIDSGFAGMRPWTRSECARQATEAEQKFANSGNESQEASEVIEALQRELRLETEARGGVGTPIARLESVYSRTEYISGKPLIDGYHFGQTQINDFGRPYGEGWSTATGFSFYTTAGRWSGYVRGELQTAPSVPALPLSARQFVSSFDGLPGLAPGTASPSVQQTQLLDAYVGLTFSDWQLSFGRQSLLWGPGDGGALMSSTNAQPIDMFRVNRVTPFSVPLVSRLFGPMRLEFFLGQLSGYHFIDGVDGVEGNFTAPLSRQPYIQGQRFSFKPTRNFEFGFSHTALMAGPGIPLTFGTLKDALLNQGKNLTGGQDLNGDGRSGLDWSYRLPLLRNWATFYGDAFNDDQPSPIAYWDRAAIRGGLFLSHLPRLKRLDLRVEGVYTDVPAGGSIGHGFFYSNDNYRSGYTNNSRLIGSWIGRDGQGAQAWANYWFNAKNRLQFSFRHQKVSQQFNPGGGTLTDAGVRVDYWVRPSLALSPSVQYEKWLFPVIQPGAEKNVTASLQILFQPQKALKLGKLFDDGSRAGDRP